MTSLVATAYILVAVPNVKPESSKDEKDKRQPRPDHGPVKKYIAQLNAGLSFFVCLNALAFKDKKGVHEGFWVLLLLPLGMSRIAPKTLLQLIA